jgi:ABC-type nitrate/sulfonate/bicarbonate transport system substrate-binding protein
MTNQSKRNYRLISKALFVARLAVAASFLLISSGAGAEPLRIAYTSIAVVYAPLWVTRDAGIFKKYNIDTEQLYIAGGPPSLQALIAGDTSTKADSTLAGERL